MTDSQNEKKIAHLGYIQGVISRMGGNLFYLRGWIVTLIAGILVLLTKTGNNELPIIFLTVIIAIFWGYDGYFLALERQYRDLYDAVRIKDESEIDFSMKLTKEILDRKQNSMLFCVFSPTLRYFYGPLLLAAGYVIFFLK